MIRDDPSFARVRLPAVWVVLTTVAILGAAFDPDHRGLFLATWLPLPAALTLWSVTGPHMWSFVVGLLFFVPAFVMVPEVALQIVAIYGFIQCPLFLFMSAVHGKRLSRAVAIGVVVLAMIEMKFYLSTMGELTGKGRAVYGFGLTLLNYFLATIVVVIDVIAKRRYAKRMRSAQEVSTSDGPRTSAASSVE